MKRSPLVIGVDVSTTAAKAIVVDGAGTTLAEGRAVFPLHNPAPGAWEQDANDWKAAAIEAIREATSRLEPEQRENIRSLSIANQRETFVVTDPDGHPLAPAIVWMDARSKPEVVAACEELAPESIHAISGKVPCTTPSLYKIRMLLTRLAPELREREKRVVDVHAFIVHALTGAWITSTAAADPLGIVDMQRADWSDDLCTLARVRREELPYLLPPGTPIGTVQDDLAEYLGLDHGVLVVAGAGDGQAAGLGAGTSDPGAAYLNIGTALVAGLTGKTYRIARAYRTLFGAMPGTFLYESDLKGGTLTLDWLADRLLGEGRFERTDARMATLASLEARARDIEPGSGGLLALPYWSGVMNPHWDDDARGALIGLSPDHGPEHLYRAICEGLAFEHRLIFEAMEREAGKIGSVVAVGGGSRSPFLLQLFSDILERPLRLAASDETTALGAAMLAAPSAGLAASVQEAAKRMTSTKEGTVPGPTAARYRQIYERSYRGLYSALAPLTK